MKAYVKPELYFESFELATHIACCQGPVYNQEMWGCLPGTENPLSVEDGLSSVTGVDETIDLQKFEKICYYAGPNGNPNS